MAQIGASPGIFATPRFCTADRPESRSFGVYKQRGRDAVKSGMALRRSGDTNSRKSNYPAEDTHQEAAYLKTLGEKQRSVTVKLLDGEVVRGWIEYYDRRMIRLTRDGAPNLFIYKHDIAYIAEDDERRLGDGPTRTSRTSGAAPTSADAAGPNE